jgi:hypothetical protein
MAAKLRTAMPEISRFFGIVIRMFFTDHPVPHFHAFYGSSNARIRLSPTAILDSNLPPRALRLTIEWASLHEAELMDNWRRLCNGEAPETIEPLE